MDIFEKAYDQEGLLFGNQPTRLLDDFLNSHDVSGEALDLGCGDGRDTIPLLARGFNVTAIDQAASAINSLQNRPEIAAAGNLTAIHCDVRKWKWPVRAFDLIVAITLLDHLSNKDIEDIVGKMFGAARDSCIIYVEVHTVDDPGFTKIGVASEFSSAIGHYFAYNELLHMFSKYLRILFYNERKELDRDHGEPHYHGFATLIGQIEPNRRKQ